MTGWKGGGPRWFAVALLLGAVVAVHPRGAMAQSRFPGAPGGDGVSAASIRAEYLAELVDRIGETMDAWRQAWREDDLDRLMELYLEDARIRFPGELPVVGHAAIRERLAELLETTGEIQAGLGDVDGSGGMGYISGNFFYVLEGGSSERVNGTHLTLIIRRGGNYGIRAQFFYADPDPSSHEPAP